MPLQVNRVKLKLKDPSVEGGWADGDLLYNAEAEAWAKGTQNGAPIAKPDGGIIDISYAHEENNAKYYADQANASVNNIASVLLNGNLAQAFNSGRSYAKGEYVLDQGILYKFTEDHTKNTSIANDLNAIEIKVVEDMSSFSNSLKDITGCQPIKFSDPELAQYVETHGSTVSWVSETDLPETKNTLTSYSGSTPSYAPYRWAMVECNEGDIFTINGTGGNNPRLWAFIKQNHQVISDKADEGASATNLIITAPAEAKWLIINDKTNSNSYIGAMELELSRKDISYMRKNKGYWNTSGKTVGSEFSNFTPTANSSMKYCIIDCKKYDCFYITSAGLSAASRPWFYINNDNIITRIAGSNTCENYFIMAKQNGKLLINSLTSSPFQIIKIVNNKESITDIINIIDAYSHMV